MPAPWARAACAALLGLVGSVFVLKYGARVDADQAWPAAAAFAPLYIAGLAALSWIAGRLSESAARRLAVGMAVLLLVAGASAALLSPDASRVARAPAASAWLDALAVGDFPYCSRILPSGLPGLFLILAPFHALGVSAWVPFAGLVLFVGVAWHLIPDARGRALSLAALIALPSLHYEGLVRSELFLNATLALAAIAVADRARRGMGKASLWAAGAFAGLAASTRLIAPLALALYLGHAARRSPQRVAVAFTIATTVFLLLLAPFVAWDAGRFFRCGPLAVQGLYLPIAVPVFALIASLALGWTAPNLGSVLVRTGAVLFALVATAFAWKAASVGAAPALWGDAFDIGYFVLPTPFLAIALAGQGGDGEVASRILDKQAEPRISLATSHFPLPTPPA